MSFADKQLIAEVVRDASELIGEMAKVAIEDSDINSTCKTCKNVQIKEDVYPCSRCFSGAKPYRYFERA